MKNKKMNPITILYYVVSLILPVLLIIITGISPIGFDNGIYVKDITTLIFFIIIFGLYILGLYFISPTINIYLELKESLKNIDNESDRFNDIDKVINDKQFPLVGGLLKEYRDTLRSVDEITEDGQVNKKYYATTDIEYFLEEENLILKKIHNKSINQITQALTGIGIFGTFLGIVKGVSGLNMENSETMKTGIETLLSGVKVSFNTSLFGILFSILLTFVLKIAIDFILHKSNELCRVIKSKVSIFTDKGGLKELDDELKKQTSVFEKLATDLAEEMGKKFDQSMQENLSVLSDNVAGLITEMQQNFANSVNENTAQTVNFLGATLQPTMEKLENAISNMQTKQEESTGRFMEESIQSIKEAINVGTSGEVSRLKESMDVISQKNAELVDTFTTSMENMKNLTMHQESLIKNTTSSTESINMTTESMQKLQQDLSVVLTSIKDVSSTNNVSLENIQSTVEALKVSMMQQAEINASLESMMSKTYKLSESQDDYISKFNNISRLMSTNISNVENYMNRINKDIVTYKEQFSNIKDSTLEVAATLDTKYKTITNDLSKANDSLSSTVRTINVDLVAKVNDMSGKLHNVVNGLDDFQRKSSQLTTKLEKFVEVEESTQDLWRNYKQSFDSLNTNINDGVQDYTKLISESVNSLFTQYDNNIANAVTSLKNMVEQLHEATDEIAESLEPIDKLATKLSEKHGIRR